MKKTRLINISVKDLKPYPKNPRINDDAAEKVKRSIEEFGYCKTSIGIDENNILLYGHTTLKAIKKLGWQEIPEIDKIEGLSEAQKKAYRLADNKLGELAIWDDALLQKEFEELSNMDFDIKIAGFEEDEIMFEEIEEISDFNETCNFIISCESTEEFEKLKKELNTKNRKISYKFFKERINEYCSN